MHLVILLSSTIQFFILKTWNIYDIHCEFVGPFHVSGCLYSLLSFCTPIITFWSTARSVEATYAFHGWFDLFASALGSFGWLLFSISQLHGEDGQIIGTAAIVVNAFGFAFYATYIVVKLAVAGYMGTRVINTHLSYYKLCVTLHFNHGVILHFQHYFLTKNVAF